jgi:dTDP-4-amino-4,6-dideoxygalactose transaminase
VAVVEDLAQAMGGSAAGRKLGTLGDAAAFVLLLTKNLGGSGRRTIVTDETRSPRRREA